MSDKKIPFCHDRPERVGVLLVNLGTPEAPTARALRPYLKEFLSDRRGGGVPPPPPCQTRLGHRGCRRGQQAAGTRGPSGRARSRPPR